MGAAAWRVPYLCGTYAYDEGQYAAAVEHFNLLTELRPRFAEAYFLTGQAYEGLGQNTNAAAAYARALELNPGYREARLRLGWAHYWAGEPRTAALIWRPIIGAVRDTSTLLTMIELYERIGDRVSAQSARAALQRFQRSQGQE